MESGTAVYVISAYEGCNLKKDVPCSQNVKQGIYVLQFLFKDSFQFGKITASPL